MLRALVAAGGQATIASLNALLGGHPNTIRIQLEHLAGDGFVTEVLLPAPGRGRPARTYAATVAGQQVALEDPDRNEQGALVEAIAEHLAGTPESVAAAHAVGSRWGGRLAAASGGDLVSILAGQGFTPEPTADGIALRTCPLLASARRYPEVVCGIHQGLIDAVAPEAYTLLPFAIPGACLIRLA